MKTARIKATASSQGQLHQTKLRPFLVLAVFLPGYLAVSLRLIDLTMLRDTGAPQSTAAQRMAAETPLRCTILDRNGELMATSLRMASVYADATLIDDPKKVARELAAILPKEKP